MNVPRPSEPYCIENLKATDASNLAALRRSQQRARTIALAVVIVLFFAAYGLVRLWQWLSSTFLPPHFL